MMGEEERSLATFRDAPRPEQDMMYLLTRHEEELMEFARSQKDENFLRNYGSIREKFAMYLANPMNHSKKPDWKKLSADWGCQEVVLKRMRKNPNFMGLVSTIMREYMLRFGGGELLPLAFEALHNAVVKGEKWAVQTALQIGGVMGTKEVVKTDIDDYTAAVRGGKET